MNAGLTPKEELIFRLVAQGKSSKVIARELGTSDGTVKNQTMGLFRKLGVTNRVEAALAWYGIRPGKDDAVAVHRLLEHGTRCRLAMQRFVDRCEAGEVRSTRTQAEFKALLEEVPAPASLEVAHG